MGDLDIFRAELRAWLAGNMARRIRPIGKRARGHLPTDEHVARQRAIQRQLFDAGYAGITWPREYGGAGLTHAHQQVFDEEAAAYEMPDFAPLTNTTFGVCGPTMVVHASEPFKRLHVPRILAGEELWAQFFSEPAAGSDLAGIRTRADRRGSSWVLSGSKVWSSGAQLADYAMCLARTDWSVPKHHGLTWFAIRTDAPGLTIRPIREINGGQEYCEEVLDEVVVADGDRIGDVNDGWTVVTTMLKFERGAGRRPGRMASAPRDLPADLVEAARRRGALTNSAVRQRIAQSHIDAYVMDELRARVAASMRRPNADPSIASYLKLAEGTFTPTQAILGLAVGGVRAVAWRPDEPSGDSVATGYLNARLRAVAGGTNEMHRNAISERVLGLPRERSADGNKPFGEVLRDAPERDVPSP